MKIRKLKLKDADRMLMWMHYEESKEIFEKDFSNYSKKDVINFINSCSENDIHYACVDDFDNYLGTVSLKKIDHDNCNAEFAISFIKEAQGTGAAMFATKELLNFGFKDLKLNKIYLNVLSTNKKAINFYNKVGFKKEGCFKKHIKKNGQYLDLEWYACFNEKYK